MAKLKLEPSKSTATPMELRHLRRETQTALELAVVALAPTDHLDRLAAAAGLLEAIVGLPADSPPVMALAPPLALRARAALEQWKAWQAEHLDVKMPRG